MDTIITARVGPVATGAVTTTDASEPGVAVAAGGVGVEGKGPRVGACATVFKGRTVGVDEGTAGRRVAADVAVAGRPTVCVGVALAGDEVVVVVAVGNDAPTSSTAHASADHADRQRHAVSVGQQNLSGHHAAVLSGRPATQEHLQQRARPALGLPSTELCDCEVRRAGLIVHTILRHEICQDEVPHL